VYATMRSYRLQATRRFTFDDRCHRPSHMGPLQKHLTTMLGYDDDFPYVVRQTYNKVKN